jgi:two-component system, OmpR family, alkaline phosphatase synthesis response regulator PhoP
MTLKSQGFKNIKACYDGKSALDEIKTNHPDLVLLDLMLPNIDGLTVCKEVKNNVTTKNIPIIMITAKNEENDIITGLELGASDYITKPFSTKVLLARVKNQLRIAALQPKDNNTFLRFKDLVINREERSVFLNNEEIKLTYSEFELLTMFVNEPHRVFTRNQLIFNIKGDDGYDVGERAIDVQILNLRKKLGSYGSEIESVRGIGYRLKS